MCLVVVGNALVPELATVGKERIALVRIEGPILDSRSTVNELEAYARDPLVKAIVLRIDSPGGGVAASQEIYNAVKRVREDKQKTVVTSMGTVAASGARRFGCPALRFLWTVFHAQRDFPFFTIDFDDLRGHVPAYRKFPNTPNTCLLYTSPSPRDS